MMGKKKHRKDGLVVGFVVSWVFLYFLYYKHDAVEVRANNGGTERNVSFFKYK